ncbi:MAG: hypothetical protein HY872_17440 [Chloroflexi bacterium]|nr:hypothetical protein [Chloroflexota bacterium]
MNVLLAFSFWGHILGISIWVGASLLVPLVINPVSMALEPPSRMKFMAEFSRRAVPWILGSAVLVFATGTLQFFLRQYSLGFNIITAKIIMALLMAANGYYVGVVLAARVGKLAPAPGTPPSPEFLKVQRMLVMHGWVQAGLAVVTVLLVAFLTA